VSAYNFGTSGNNPTKRDMPRDRRDNVGTTFVRVTPNKIWDGKNVQNLRDF